MTREEERIMIPKKIKKIYLNNVDEMQDREYIDLSQVWHDASVVPTEDTLILYRTTSGECEVTELLCTSEGVWHLFVKDYKVSQWAYIDDLLPKGGEK